MLEGCNLDSEKLAFYKGKKVLITGASGYIGSAISYVLSKAECNQILHINKEARDIANKKNDRIQIAEGDLLRIETWDSLLAGVNIIFHLAAQRTEVFDPYKDLDINARMVLTLLESCRKKGYNPKIVFASSSTLAGTQARLPVDETFSDEPLTIYALHKLLAEKYLGYYTREYGISSISLRLANVFGPVPNEEVAERVVVNRIISQVLKSGTLNLFKNKNCIRDYIYIDDTVNAFLSAGLSGDMGNGNFFYIGSGTGFSIEKTAKQISDRLLKLSGIKTTILYDESTKISKIEMRDFTANYKAFNALTGWIPRIAFDVGIERTIDYFKKRQLH